MSQRVVDWQPPSLAVAGDGVFPVRHAWCVGRNYAEHAREMGAVPGDPVFFAKPAHCVVNPVQVEYPAGTESLHHEVELVVFLGRGGRGLSPQAARECVYGYAVGVDLTRRDLQARLKQAGQPWELAKGFDDSGPVGAIMPAGHWTPSDQASIELRVNGQTRQRGELGDMLWPVGELLARLSAEVTLEAGDVIFTGTPSGVGELAAGDEVTAHIEGLPELEFVVVAPRVS